MNKLYNLYHVFIFHFFQSIRGAWKHQKFPFKWTPQNTKCMWKCVAYSLTDVSFMGMNVATNHRALGSIHD